MLSCLVAAALWAISLSLYRAAIGEIGARAANFFKCATAAILYWVWILALGPGGSLGTPRLWLSLAISGVVGFTVGDLLLFTAVRLGGVQRALVLFNTSPIITALLAIPLLHEVPAARTWFGMALVLTGVGLVETDPRRLAAGAGAVAGGEAGAGSGIAEAVAPRAGNPEGPSSRRWAATFAGLGAAAGQAGGILFARGPLQVVPVLPATAIRLTAAVVTLLPLLAVAGPGRGFAGLAPRRWPGLLLPTLLGTVVALLFAMRGIRDIPAGISSSLLATTPLWALPISVFALREPIGPRSVAGTFLGVGGILLL